MPIRKVMFVLLLGLVANADADQQWARFRGPNGTGIAPSLEMANEWTSDDYAWSVDLPGRGHSSPVVWDKTVVVTAAEGDTLSVCCYNLETGKRLRKFEFKCPPRKMHAANSTAATTPAIDAQHIYVTWADADAVYLAAIDYAQDADDNVAWQARLPSFVGNHGFASSPVVIGDSVCVNVDGENGGSIFAFSAADGEEKWRAPRAKAEKESYSTPCVIEVDGKTLVIAESTGGGLQAVDPADGQIEWTLSDVLPSRTVSSPCVAGDLVLATCGSGGGGHVLVGARCGATESRVEFTLTNNVPYVPTILAKDDLLFLWHDQGIVTCLERDTREIVWRKRVSGNYFGSPICIGDRLIAMSRDGEAVVLAASREYELLGRVDLGESSQATPAVAGGRLLLRTESKLHCLN